MAISGPQMASLNAWRSGSNSGKMSARFSTAVLMHAIVIDCISL
jgi:hypothetical protein